MVTSSVKKKAELLEKEIGEGAVRHAEKSILLRILDQHWKDHLLVLDHIRHGINLRAYAQGNPLNEYKREAFNQFQLMMSRLKIDFLSALHHFKTSAPVDIALDEMLGNVDFTKMRANYPEEGEEELPQVQMATPDQKISRNALCPCNSGKKFKHCHGAID